MSNNPSYSLKKDRWAEFLGILAFIGTLLLAALATVLLYLIPVEVLIIATALGFVPMAYYFISRH